MIHLSEMELAVGNKLEVCRVRAIESRLKKANELFDHLMESAKRLTIMQSNWMQKYVDSCESKRIINQSIYSAVANICFLLFDASLKENQDDGESND